MSLISWSLTTWTLHTSSEQTKLSVNTCTKHVSNGSSLESLQSSPAHHRIKITNSLEVLSRYRSSVVEQIVVSVLHVDDWRRG